MCQVPTIASFLEADSGDRPLLAEANRQVLSRGRTAATQGRTLEFGMGRAKKKLLPKEFDELLKQGDLAALKEVFATCQLDARGGYAKQTALAYAECPDELATWLVASGADIQAPDARGNTPLHSRARSWRGSVAVLIDLGANVNDDTASIGTPLHAAADSHKDANARTLIERGAQVDAINSGGLTPLELALRGCSNIDIEPMERLGRMLLDAGARKTEEMPRYIERIGQTFEFHRAGFSAEHVDAASAALEALYDMFGVTPVPRRTMHDGLAPIPVRATAWSEQHQELWQMLVPSKGAAATVQGEVIRLSGRIANELSNNGGVNWDDDYRQMAVMFLQHMQDANPLPPNELAEAVRLIAEVQRKSGDTDRLCELAVKWVLLNPEPIALRAPSYKR